MGEHNAKRQQQWGALNKKEQFYHINILQLVVVKLAILAFTKLKGNLHLNVEINIKADLPYILEMDSTKNPLLILIET